jgi:hypothetical protein
MKTFYLLIASLFVFAACKPTQKLTQQQKTDCQRFRTGTFKMISYSTNTEYIVVRDEKIQKEKDNKSAMDLKIKWLNDCSYEISPADGSKQGPVKIKVTLSNIHGDTCDYIARPTNPQYPTQNGIFIIEK